jgi:regulator of cell morphogenesis and NO signaling
MMKKNITVGEIVAIDYRAAEVFKEAGIDFCCGGKKSIDEMCTEKGIDKVELIRKLEELESTPNTTIHNFMEWEPGFLCDYIVNTHHKYVLKTLPDLVGYTEKIASVHGKGHPELEEVAILFSKISLLQDTRFLRTDAILTILRSSFLVSLKMTCIPMYILRTTSFIQKH